MVNANLEAYKVAGPREVPAIEVAVLENLQGRSATDAYGIAEPANIATAPAIGNAVQRDRRAVAVAADDARRPFLRPSGNCRPGADPMRNFAFGEATIAQAAASAGLVAEAMLAADGSAQSRDVRVVKAGGIDLIDLMKEGLLVPAEVTSLQRVPGLTRSPRRPRAASASGRWSRSPVSRRTRRYASAIRRWRRRRASRRARRSARSPPSAATCCSDRTAGIPARPISLPAQGRRPLLRDFRREPVLTRSSTTGSARSSILRPRPLRWSRSGQRSN